MSHPRTETPYPLRAVASVEADGVRRRIARSQNVVRPESEPSTTPAGIGTRVSI
jgi:hypothetical protein